jgi:N-acyl-D-aspartate/D-glutamate deacylase
MPIVRHPTSLARPTPYVTFMRHPAVHAALLAGALLATPISNPVAAQQPTLDLLIRNGRVLDGTGSPARITDVGLAGERIVFIGDARAEGHTARRTIDATGLIVAPGFIDPHTHTTEDLGDSAGRRNVGYLMQGVTTVLTGNDGGGPIDVAATLAHWDSAGIGTNAGLFVGHGTVRRALLGSSNASPNAEQLGLMRALVSEAMQGGAIGLSSGLYYAPGSFATTEEVIALAAAAGEVGGIYDTHMRDESSYTIGLLGSIRESIRIGREARVPVNISHIKALGTDVWGRSDSVIALIREARAAGIAVTADQYPYTASGTGLGAALLPRWAEAGGGDSLRARIANPSLRPRLVAEMTENLRRRGGPESLLITSGRDTSLRGKTLGAIAARQGLPPVEAALRIIGVSSPSVASFNMNEADIERFMAEDFVMTGSDGSGGHPRKFGTYPRKLRHYVYTKKTISLPFFIRASTSLPAETFKLKERGILREGYFADVVVFDERTVADRSTYEEPTLLAAGMRWVVVNGKLAVDDGRPTGSLAGRALRGPAATTPQR